MRRYPWIGLCAVMAVVASTGCSDDDDGGGANGGAAGSGGGAAGTGGSAGSGGGTAGTGGGSAGTGGGDPSDCEVACEKITAQNCPAEPDQPTCVGDCEQDIVGSATCGQQGADVTACVAATAAVSCDEEGDAQFEGCNDELAAWFACSGCDPDEDDTACDTCQKTQCCDEFKALAGDPAFFDLQACLDPCGDDESCVDACVAQYPQTAQSLMGFFDCMNQSCAAHCE